MITGMASSVILRAAKFTSIGIALFVFSATSVLSQDDRYENIPSYVYEDYFWIGEARRVNHLQKKFVEDALRSAGVIDFHQSFPPHYVDPERPDEGVVTALPQAFRTSGSLAVFNPSVHQGGRASPVTFRLDFTSNIGDAVGNGAFYFELTDGYGHGRAKYCIFDIRVRTWNRVFEEESGWNAILRDGETNAARTFKREISRRVDGFEACEDFSKLSPDNFLRKKPAAQPKLLEKPVEQRKN